MGKGILYIIAGPIGNLQDITFRAIDILKNKIDCIYCEDTRQTGKLLSYYDIKIHMHSLHAHSSEIKINRAITLLTEGKSIAYMTDSGTPGLSDPGSSLIRLARLSGISVLPVPGPSALTSIISISGFPGKDILFAGFLSKKENKIKKELEKLKQSGCTLIFYESPYRIKRLIGIIYEIFPDSEIIIGREMTKFHEEFIYGKTKDIYSKIDTIKEIGEFTIAVYTP